MRSDRRGRRSRGSRMFTGLVLLWGCVGLACANAGDRLAPRVPAAGTPSSDPDGLRASGALLPAGALPGTLFMRQWVTIRWGDDDGDGDGEGEVSFEAVLQKRGDTLLLLGLDALGRIGFRIALEDERVSLENRSGRELPFAPEYILADVQRIFYPWLPDDVACRRCERRGNRSGLEIVERWDEGRRVARTFARTQRPSEVGICVRYEAAGRGASERFRATLRNDWRGYAIEVVELDPDAKRDAKEGGAATDTGVGVPGGSGLERAGACPQAMPPSTEIVSPVT